MSLTAHLTIDLDAIVANWRALDALSAPQCETAAVVKADGYGCGAGRVGSALAHAGARTFFVAVPSEGVSLRNAIGPGPRIYILGGYGRAEQAMYRQHDLRPVLNSVEQAEAWFADANAPCAIQIDTGMNRLGMEAADFTRFADAMPSTVDFVMSHMGNADDPGHGMNTQQRAEFERMTSSIQGRSLSATAGLLLGPDYHYDLTRMGIGLYGGWPFSSARSVVTVEAPIIQIRDLTEGENVGYGATWVAKRSSRIATISAGYADGLIRFLSHGATAYISGQPVPFAGRVSMDLITLDVTDCDCAAGDMVELLGPNQSIDEMAKSAGTIGHEVLTAMAHRYARTYIGGPASA